jgi:hypothetical protein
MSPGNSGTFAKAQYPYAALPSGRFGPCFAAAFLQQPGKVGPVPARRMAPRTTTAARLVPSLLPKAKVEAEEQGEGLGATQAKPGLPEAAACLAGQHGAAGWPPGAQKDELTKPAGPALSTAGPVSYTDGNSPICSTAQQSDTQAGLEEEASLVTKPVLPLATVGRGAADGLLVGCPGPAITTGPALATTRADPPSHTRLLHRPGAQEAKQAASPALATPPASLPVYTNASVPPDTTTVTRAGVPGRQVHPGHLPGHPVTSALWPVELEAAAAGRHGATSWLSGAQEAELTKQAVGPALATTRADPPSHTRLLHQPGAQEAKQPASPALATAPAGLAVYTDAPVPPDTTTVTGAGVPGRQVHPGHLPGHSFTSALRPVELETGVLRPPARTSTSALRPVELETGLWRWGGDLGHLLSRAALTAPRAGVSGSHTTLAPGPPGALGLALATHPARCCPAAVGREGLSCSAEPAPCAWWGEYHRSLQ